MYLNLTSYLSTNRFIGSQALLDRENCTHFILCCSSLMSLKKQTECKVQNAIDKSTLVCTSPST